MRRAGCVDQEDEGEQISCRYLFSPQETGKAKKVLDLKRNDF